MTKLAETSAANAPANTTNQATTRHLRGSTLLLAGRVIAMAVNFAIQVLIVRYLSKSDYGAFAYALSLVSLGSSLAVFGFDKTVTRFVPKYQESGDSQKVYGSLLMMVSAVLSLGFFLVLLVFVLRGWLSNSLINDPPALRLLMVLVFLIPIQALDSLLVGMLAIFAKPNSIFIRRFVLGPSLRLSVVLLLIYLHKDVYFLSMGLLLAGAIGIAVYYGILLRELRQQESGSQFHIRHLSFPVREVFGFSTPLFASSFVFMARTQLVIILLEFFRSTLDVAAYRAVQPVADLNSTVTQSFGLLFMPTMARMFARKDREGMHNLYWQSAVWNAVISFPIFLLTFSLATPLTLLFFGERYAQSASIMAVLACGYYFNTALGFNADTLRILGRLRQTVIIDVVALVLGLGLNLLLIPRYGALGAAFGTSGTLVIYNILNQLSLRAATSDSALEWRYVRVYLSIIAGTVILAVVQSWLDLPVILGVLLTGLISLLVLLFNRSTLNVEHTFPELLRLRPLRLLFGSRGARGTAAGHADQSSFFADHIQKHASDYYSGLGTEPANVECVNKIVRRSAHLYQFSLGNRAERHSVFVKVFLSLSPNGHSLNRTNDKKPLFPVLDQQDRHRLHYTALSAIYSYFAGLDRDRFGAIRVLDYLPNRHAVVMDGSKDVKLRQLFWKQNGSYSLVPNPGLVNEFQNVGMWLNLYHRMPKDDALVRHASRADYIEIIRSLTDYLIKAIGDRSFFEKAASILIDRAEEVLPSQLPLGLAHGDFAQRNILVGPNARVTVLDTFATWRTPIYQDIGYFMTDLRMAYPQAITQQVTLVSEQLLKYEQAFLRGYFGQDAVPYPAIRLYESLALLDKWSTLIARSNAGKVSARLITKGKRPFFKRGLQGLLRELARVAPAVLIPALGIMPVAATVAVAAGILEGWL